MSYNAPKGTSDMMPAAARLWRHATDTATKLFARYGYEPIDTPLFELTEVFTRSIGEATDVVGKEMFAVRSGQNYKRALVAGDDAVLEAKQKLSLRPEGTAGVVRAAVQHNLVGQGSASVKLFYAGPMFRAERPQKGRLRQFHQIGAECLGSTKPTADAEMIIMLMRFFERMGLPIDSMRLLINSMGDAHCRPAYREEIRQYILDHGEGMCEECRHRAQTNPLRAFDCKNEACVRVMAEAPKITDRLCDDCREHYEAVRALLDALGINYVEDPTLVRGLDYYTRTVFEVQVTEGMGSQSAIGGGGRYDELVENMGGHSTPGLGFALGFERMVLALEAAGVLADSPRRVDAYIACVDDSVRSVAFELLMASRDAGLTMEMDHQGKSLKSQFKMADRLGASVVIILGPEEIACGKARLRNMHSRNERLVDLASARSLLAQFGGSPIGAASTPISINDFFALKDS